MTEGDGKGHIIIILILLAIVIYILISSGVLKPLLDKIPLLEFK